MRELFTRVYQGNYKLYLLPVAILFVLFLVAIFVFPGISKGIDLEGGTLIIIRTDKEVSSNELEEFLIENFNFKELRVASVSGPTGAGVTIQYAENIDLSKAASEFELARATKALPEESKQHSLNVIEMFPSLAKELEIPQKLDYEDALEFADTVLIKAKASFENKLLNSIKKRFSLSEAKMQIRDIRPVLGATFWENAITVSMISFTLVVLVIFIFFREIIPALAVLAAAIFDVSAALAGMAVFQIPLSLSTIPALLMLVGYSVDTDIMLTSRLLKGREKSHAERAADSIVTGITMTGTTLAALSVMLVLSYFGQISIIFEIAAVLLFGLIADLPSTWLMNSPILLMYIEHKEKKKRHF